MTSRADGSASTTRRLWPLLADLVCVVALALGGKSSHEASASEWIVLTIAWPFAAAALLAHVGLAVARRPARPVWPEGAVVVAVTYALGMVLRAASGRGLAPGFLVVAALFLVLTMLGWRVVARLVSARR
ncbi:DUF3054 domain-containing protein [Nocardioides aquiterrae]|uniref:DUF3054 domain-containing protein n=1 Tax=Nocardioides aquiterrae TaxID=203799 RepID=A0ABP4FBM5_9ACTN